jgi:hypothetical protein
MLPTTQEDDGDTGWPVPVVVFLMLLGPFVGVVVVVMSVGVVLLNRHDGRLLDWSPAMAWMLWFAANCFSLLFAFIARSRLKRAVPVRALMVVVLVSAACNLALLPFVTV